MARLVLIAIPVMLLAGLAVQPALSRLIKESQEDGHHKHAILVETLSGLETIKALGAGALLRKRWQEAVAHQSQVGLKTRFLAQLATNVAVYLWRAQRPKRQRGLASPAGAAAGAGSVSGPLAH